LQEAAPPRDPFSRHVTHRKNDPQHNNRNCRLAESQVSDPTTLNPEDVFPLIQPITEVTNRFCRNPLHHATTSIAVHHTSKPMQFPTTFVAVWQNFRIVSR
jgi:hypothetical protein